MTTDPNGPGAAPMVHLGVVPPDRVVRRLPRPMVEMLAREVLTRLSQRNGALPKTRQALPVSDPAAITALARALMSDDPTEGAGLVDQLFDAGASLEVVYLAHLAPAARLLGEWWADDHVPFTDVAIASSRILSITRKFRYLADIAPAHTRRAAAFAAVPGETHLIGVNMAADLFRQRGWRVSVLTDQKHDDLVAAFERENSGVIGISVAGTHGMEPLARLMVAMRIARPTARIIIGGAATLSDPKGVMRTDPDEIIGDMETATDVLQRLEARFPAS